MALATLADVKRILRITDSVSDPDISAVLESAEAWVKAVYGGAWDATGAQVKKFFKVRQDDILVLPDPDPIVTKVESFFILSDNNEQSSLLTLNTTYQVLTGGKVQLLFSELAFQRGYDVALGRRLPGYYDRVEVTYTPSGAVPKPVREAVALIAAAAYTQQPADTGGLVGESIGSYSYSRAVNKSGMEVIVPARARALLRPYSRRGKARVV